MRNEVLASVLAAVLSASLAGQSVGPDVIVSSLTDVGAYGQAQGITAFAVGTVACNIGTTPVQWTSSNNQHPVIAQNMYRYPERRVRPDRAVVAEARVLLHEQPGLRNLHRSRRAAAPSWASGALTRTAQASTGARACSARGPR